jgi:hypothetical protein
MNRFGSDTDRMAAPQPSAIGLASAPSLKRFLWIGGLGFGLVSLLVFATVAFAERWMYRNLGLGGAYSVWTILFILLGGAVLNPLMINRRRWLRFYSLFGAAFLSYAIGWIAAYFTLRGALGEWVGAVVGSILMGLVLAFGFGALRSSPKLIAVLFIANSAGYFLGDKLNNSIGGKPGMLLWGAAYGLFFGAGLGAALYFAQAARQERPNPSSV